MSNYERRVERLEQGQVLLDTPLKFVVGKLVYDDAGAWTGADVNQVFFPRQPGEDASTLLDRAAIESGGTRLVRWVHPDEMKNKHENWLVE